MMSIQHVSMFELTAELSGKALGRPVVDATGLKGRYDIRMDPRAAQPPRPAGDKSEGEKAGSRPDPADQASAIIDMLRDQLGLKLESRKQAVDILIVDHAEKTPTSN